MVNEELLLACKMLAGYPNAAIYFNTALVVKTTPHNEICRCWACVVTDAGELKLMDSNEKWHTLELTDTNAKPVLQTLYQRLKTIQIESTTANR